MANDPNPPIPGSSGPGRPAVGQRVADRYRLEEWLGQGGMGTVFRATDESLDLQVALKFLNETLASDPAALDDLKRETRRALQLTHPNIVRVHGLVQDPARPACIAMEFVPGENLMQRRWRRKIPFFEVDDIRLWTIQLCDALAYAHGKPHIIHRDLKPGNLLLDVEDDLKITDFGIAASANESISRITGSSASGTMSYMSPQQAAGERPMPTDDLYALGSTLYELLTGEPPLGRDLDYTRMKNEVPVSIRERRRQLHDRDAPIPDAWEETICALLAKRAADRPASARETAQRLGLITDSARLQPPPATGPEDAEEEMLTQFQSEPLPSDAIPPTLVPERVPPVPKPQPPPAADEAEPAVVPPEPLPPSIAASEPAQEELESKPPRNTLLLGAIAGLIFAAIGIVFFLLWWWNRP